MIFSSVGLFLVSSTLLGVAKATRRPSQQMSEALTSTPDTHGSEEVGVREVQVNGAGALTPLGADAIGGREREVKTRLVETTDLLAAVEANHTEEPDLQKLDASGATRASQLAASLLVKQKMFFIEERPTEHPPIIFAEGEEDSLYIHFSNIGIWQMSAGDPSHFGYIQQRRWSWEKFDVPRALDFFVAPRNRPRIDEQTEPFLLSGVDSGVDDQGEYKNLALVFGYVNVETPKLTFVKLLYLVPDRDGIFKVSDSFETREEFKVKHGIKRYLVFGYPAREDYADPWNYEPENDCLCGYTLRLGS